MKGTIIGDIVGSRYETELRAKTLDFPLFPPGSRFTDDTVTTVAVAAALMEGKETHTGYTEPLRRQLRTWCRKYPDAGFGGFFKEWFKKDQAPPYDSFGNGAAMRVSPAAWVASSLEEAQTLAELTAVITHDHPQAVRGAVAVASAIFLARQGKTKTEIAAYLRQYFYPLDKTLDEIRPGYQFICDTDHSIPEALICFLESSSFEDCLRQAVYLNGDTDTQAAIAGSIAEAYYGVPEALWQKALTYIHDQSMLHIIDEFYQQYVKRGCGK